jgi:hypothetical protein
VWGRFAQRPVGLRAVGAAVIAASLVVTYLPHLFYARSLQTWRTVRPKELATLTELVERHRPPSGLIWGDSALVPLLAVRTGLRIAGHEIDTNAKRFRSGAADAREMLPRLFENGEPPAALLIREHGAWMVPEVRSFFDTRVKRVFAFRARALGADCVYYLGLRARSEAPHQPSSKTR